MDDAVLPPRIFKLKDNAGARQFVLDVCSHLVRHNVWLRKQASPQVFFILPGHVVTSTLRASQLGKWGPELEGTLDGQVLLGLAFFAHTIADYIDEVGRLQGTETGYALWIRLGSVEESFSWRDRGDVAFQRRTDLLFDLAFLESHIRRLETPDKK